MRAWKFHELPPVIDARVPAVEEEAAAFQIGAEERVFGQVHVGDPQRLVASAHGPALVQPADARD